MSIWLNESHLRTLLPTAELIRAMEAALDAFSAGTAQQPIRLIMEPKGQPVLFTMPASFADPPVMGAKLVTLRKNNPEPDIPSIQATVVILNGITGQLLACMEGRYITQARTAAVSAAAVRALALPETKKLAILGSGVQASGHLNALRVVRDFDDVSCWSPTAANLARFAEKHSGVTAAASAEDAVRDADVIALVTSSSEPVIRNEWVKPGACIVCVGAPLPNQREIDPALVARSRLIVDSREAALHESGDVIQGIAEGLFTADHIVAELGDVIAGRTQGRTSPDDITIFKSLGMAVEDIATGWLAYQRAVETGVGTPLA